MLGNFHQRTKHDANVAENIRANRDRFNQQFRKLAGRDAGGAGKVAEIVAGGPHSDV